MKLLYTHPNSIVVAQARSSVELAGIACTIRNEYAAGAIGELAPIDTWPELWVVHEADYESARLAIERAHAEIQEADWQCGRCTRFSPDTFDLCWNCGRERPTK